MHHSINSMRISGFILILGVFGLPTGAMAKVAPATKPATRAAVRAEAAKPAPAQSAEAKANLAVAKAVGALKKEYGEHQKDPIAPLRKECNYFVEQPDGEVSVEAIFNALDRRVGDDLASDAYVKWQLLSGIKGKVDRGR